jgi:hypothetical protein
MPELGGKKNNEKQRRKSLGCDCGGGMECSVARCANRKKETRRWAGFFVIRNDAWSYGKLRIRLPAFSNSAAGASTYRFQ